MIAHTEDSNLIVFEDGKANKNTLWILIMGNFQVDTC